MKNYYITFCLVIILLFNTLAKAQNTQFSTTSLQLNYGTGFTDNMYGYNTQNKGMSTVVFENFLTWKYGTNFFMVAYLNGKFLDFNDSLTNERSRIYTECAPNLSLCKILNIRELKLPIIRDVYLGAQLSMSSYSSFFGQFIGGGVSFRVPKGALADLFLYYRHDNFNNKTIHSTFVYTFPFRLGRTYWSIEGVADASQLKYWGTDALAQPRLFWVPFYNRTNLRQKNWCKVGIEYYVHYNNRLNIHAPQLALRMTW